MAKECIISDYSYSTRIPKLADALGSVAVEDCDEYSFNFDNSYGVGHVRGINFDHGLGLNIFDIKGNEDIILHHQLGRRHPMSFLYVLSGQVEVSNSLSEHVVDLASGQTCIYAPKGDSTYSFRLKAGGNVKLVYASVIRYLFLGKIECDLDTLPEKLQELFKDTVGEHEFSFESSSDPVTINILSQLFENQQTGVEGKILIEARSLELVTNLIKRFRIEKSAHIVGHTFSNYDIKAINTAKNIIISNIDKISTVKELSLSVGMNVNKLQKGFQLIFDKSIRQFIISFRMHMALHLLQQGNLSITQIAHHIGYTNKGHFSQLFKKEFGLLPSEYRSSIFNPIALSESEHSSL